MDFWVFILCLVGMGMGFSYLTQKGIRGVQRKDERYSAEETELIQELNKNLTKMEERIESLETLLAEQAQTNRPPTYEEVMRQRNKADR